MIHINKFKQLHISLDKTTVQFFNKQMKEKKIQMLFMVHLEYFLEDYLYQEHSVTLKRKEKSLVVIQM